MKVVFLAYSFPPIKGSGTFRPYFFAKYVSPKIEKLTVYSALPDGNLDDSLKLDELERTEIIRINQNGKKKLKDFLSKNRLVTLFNFIFPSLFWQAAAPWARDVYKQFCLNYHPGSVDVIYATSEPFSSAVTAYRVFKKFKIPYIVDLRDPFMENPYHVWSSVLHAKRFERLEGKVLKNAKKVIVTSPTYAKYLKKKYPFLVDRIELIFNGFEGDVEGGVSSVNNGKIKIVYAGTLSDWDGIQKKSRDHWYSRPYIRTMFNMESRSLYMLLKGIAASKDFEKIKQELEIHIYGNGNLPKTNKLIRDLGLESVVILNGTVSYDEVLKAQKEADYMMLIVEDPIQTERNFFVAGKIFDFIKLKKKVVVLGKSNDATDILESIGLLKSRIDNNVEQVGKKIIEWTDKDVFPIEYTDKIDIYKRKRQAERLLKIINE